MPFFTFPHPGKAARPQTVTLTRGGSTDDAAPFTVLLYGNRTNYGEAVEDSGELYPLLNSLPYSPECIPENRP